VTHNFLHCMGGIIVFPLVLAGCGSDEPGSVETGTGGSSATAGTTATGGMVAVSGGASGTGGTLGPSGGTPSTGGSGNVGGAPLRPPNPRTDIGPPDGTHCIGNKGPAIDCAGDQQCCPAGLSDTATECSAPGTICTNCKSEQCGAVLCDGPEDCPGQLCCYAETTCDLAGAPCISSYGVAKCLDRCSEDDRLGQFVVCRADRDCLRTTEQCTRRTTLPDIYTCL
jgi:hypothetical protein